MTDLAPQSKPNTIELLSLAERLEWMNPDHMIGEKGTTFLYSEDIKAMVIAMRSHAALKVRVEELRKALEPFAKIKFDMAFWEDADTIDIDNNKLRLKSLTVGDFQLAAKTIAALSTGEAGE